MKARATGLMPARESDIEGARPSGSEPHDSLPRIGFTTARRILGQK